MSKQRPHHLTDEQILRFIDDETLAHETEAAEQHLVGCQNCQARELYLRSSLAEMVAVLSPSLDTSLPDSEPARTQLKAYLQHAARPGREGWLRRLEVALHRQPRSLRYAELAITVLAVCLITWRGVNAVDDLSASRNEATLEPDHVLTPGATRPVTLAEICPLNDDDLDPDVAPQKRQAVFDAYRIKPKAKGKDYQVDYLINPQLGGTDDIKNLWPEPYSSVWNAQAKDTLEKRLHQMVCERQIDLASAQRDIAIDWIAAYKKYFHSEKPV